VGAGFSSFRAIRGGGSEVTAGGGGVGAMGVGGSGAGAVTVEEVADV
jgi:hypothetical protein